jgi:hypothetical protein
MGSGREFRERGPSVGHPGEQLEGMEARTSRATGRRARPARACPVELKNQGGVKESL